MCLLSVRLRSEVVVDFEPPNRAPTRLIRATAPMTYLSVLSALNRMPGNLLYAIAHGTTAKPDGIQSEEAP